MNKDAVSLNIQIKHYIHAIYLNKNSTYHLLNLRKQAK